MLNSYCVYNSSSSSNSSDSISSNTNLSCLADMLMSAMANGDSLVTLTTEPSRFYFYLDVISNICGITSNPRDQSSVLMSTCN